MVPDPLLPIRFGPGSGGPPLSFRLSGLPFVAPGALNLFRPRETAAWQFCRRQGETDGTTAPSGTRAPVMRAFGGFSVLVGFGISLGPLP